MKEKLYLLLWTILIPILAWVAYFSISVVGIIPPIVFSFLLIGCVLAAVHHAEVIAYRVGEPFGSFLLALAITIIEVALIVSLMLTGGELETKTLARDTVFAAVMIILTGIIGICILVGATKYKEQTFTLQGVSTALITLTAILAFALILPNYTTSTQEPEYNSKQLIFIALVCFILYITFIMIQSIRHRAYFLSPKAKENEIILPEKPTAKVTIISTLFLFLCLGIVVLLAKSLAPDIEKMVLQVGAPKSMVGVIIAGVVLLPEGYAAYRAAKNNQLQTSLNLALGSALASIGLTIPAVAIVSIATGASITLGIDLKAMTLLLLAQFIIILSLATGRTNILQGIVLLMIFFVYLFTTVFP